MKEVNRSIYFDNASTSFPKAPGIGKAMGDYLETTGCNVGRGGYELSYQVEEKVYHTRKQICNFFDFHENFDSAKNMIFTSGVTQSLNLVLKGMLKKGDHVLVSGMEHNAVMRPLHDLKQQEIVYDIIPCDRQGNLKIERIEEYLQENTKAIIMIHASNVCGTLLPIQTVANICQRNNLYFILDAAQTAGVIPISMTEIPIDALCFTGHKGLLGPQGIGGAIIRDKLAEEMKSLVQGGTGSQSESFDMPEFLPDKLEAGTLNIPGIYGLSQALVFLEKVGLKNIAKKEMDLSKELIRGIGNLKNLDLIGIPDVTNRVAVISLISKTKDNAQVAFELDREFGIMTRVGLHCAPLAHQSLKTYPKGTIRLALGYFNNREEVCRCLDALEQITRSST